jgi:hypothetical protein
MDRQGLRRILQHRFARGRRAPSLLKATIAVEHWALDHFKGKTGAWWKSLKYFVAWLILFGSKFVILEA